MKIERTDDDMSARLAVDGHRTGGALNDNLLTDEFVERNVLAGVKVSDDVEGVVLFAEQRVSRRAVGDGREFDERP